MLAVSVLAVPLVWALVGTRQPSSDVTVVRAATAGPPSQPSVTSVTTVPVDEVAKHKPAPGEPAVTGSEFTLDDARRAVLADPHSLLCIAPDGTYTVMLYSPVLTPSGPRSIPPGFVPTVDGTRFPRGTTCQTHDEVARQR